MPDPAAASKLPRRFWLWAPYAAVAIAAVAGAGAWFGEKARLEQGLDAAAANLRAEGYAVSWQSRRIDGFPFRLDLTFDQLRMGEPSGWAVATPRLKGEAYTYEPDRWVFFAPSLAITRPGKGALDVTGQAIRASLAGLPAKPRFSFEGVKLAFTPEAGATPGLLSAADRLELHLLPGPDDQAAVLLRVDGGQAALAGKPVGALLDARLTHASQLIGGAWPSAVNRWRAAGGQMTVARGEVRLGGALVLKDAQVLPLLYGASALAN